MKTILITSRQGLDSLARNEKSHSLLSNIETIIHSGGEELETEIVSILEAWESLRQQRDQATRYNNPYMFGRSLLMAAENNEQVCALLLFNELKICSVLRGTIKRYRIKSYFGPFSVPMNKLTSLTIPQTGLVYDGRIETLQMMQHVLSNFSMCGVIDCIDLKNIRVESEWYNTLIKRYNEKPWHISEIPKIRWHTKLIDPETKQRLHFNSSKTRSTQRRKDRLLMKYFDGDVEMRVITENKDVDKFILKASSIVKQTYQVSLNIGIRDGDERQRAFLHELANEGFLYGYILMAKGEAIAYVVGDLCSKTFSLWATSYLPEYSKLSPGTVLIRRVMEHLAGEGVIIFDFGWGESEYKRVLGSHKIDENDVRLYASRLIPSIAYIIEISAKSLDRLAKRLLNSMDLVDSIRRVWRRRLTKK